MRGVVMFVVNVGVVPKTNAPEPVSSEICPAMPEESVVAVNALVPFPMRRPVRVVAPVPPYGTPMVEPFQTPDVTVPRVVMLDCPRYVEESPRAPPVFVRLVPVRSVKVSLLMLIPEEKVARPLIAAVPVAVRLAAERFPEKRPLPWTESAWEGVLVPIPTFPLLSIFSLWFPAPSARMMLLAVVEARPVTFAPSMVLFAPVVIPRPVFQPMRVLLFAVVMSRPVS
jgi:hypothetical protein